MDQDRGSALVPGRLSRPELRSGERKGEQRPKSGRPLRRGREGLPIGDVGRCPGSGQRAYPPVGGRRGIHPRTRSSRMKDSKGLFEITQAEVDSPASLGFLIRPSRRCVRRWNDPIERPRRRILTYGHNRVGRQSTIFQFQRISMLTTSGGARSRSLAFRLEAYEVSPSDEPSRKSPKRRRPPPRQVWCLQSGLAAALKLARAPTLRDLRWNWVRWSPLLRRNRQGPPIRWSSETLRPRMCRHHHYRSLLPRWNCLPRHSRLSYPLRRPLYCRYP